MPAPPRPPIQSQSSSPGGTSAPGPPRAPGHPAPTGAPTRPSGPSGVPGSVRPRPLRPLAAALAAPAPRLESGGGSGRPSQGGPGGAPLSPSGKPIPPPPGAHRAPLSPSGKPIPPPPGLGGRGPAANPPTGPERRSPRCRTAASWRRRWRQQQSPGIRQSTCERRLQPPRRRGWYRRRCSRRGRLHPGSRCSRRPVVAPARAVAVPPSAGEAAGRHNGAGNAVGGATSRSWKLRS